MRYASRTSDGALFWADNGVGYVVSGGTTDKDRLNQVARLVYDQTEKSGRLDSRHRIAVSQFRHRKSGMKTSARLKYRTG